MKKMTIFLMTSMILFGWISNLWAGEILGYTIVAKQAKFYRIILSVIGASSVMVFTTYFCLWMADMKKKWIGVETMEKWRLCFEDFSLSI